MDMDNYGLHFVILIFCPPLVTIAAGGDVTGGLDTGEGATMVGGDVAGDDAGVMVLGDVAT